MKSSITKYGWTGSLTSSIHPDQVGVAKLHAELGFMHECFVFVAILGPRGQQLLQGEPALSPLLQDFHHDRRGAGMDGTDVAIAADSIVAGRVDVGCQGPLRTGLEHLDGSDCLGRAVRHRRPRPIDSPLPTSTSSYQNPKSLSNFRHCSASAEQDACLRRSRVQDRARRPPMIVGVAGRTMRLICESLPYRRPLSRADRAALPSSCSRVRSGKAGCDGGEREGSGAERWSKIRT